MTATKQAPSKVGVISIRPYIDATVDNMGLQNYGLALFDGVAHEEQLACIEQNGVRRYLTGLNEFAPEIKMIEDEDLRKARVKEIRSTVAQLEKELAANVINVDDPDFWNKVKVLRPDNDEFWGKVTLRCSNQEQTLDPAKPMDLIKLLAIEAGGFIIVAKSFEAARSMTIPPKFYLDKTVETAVTRIEVKKLRNKALAKLQEMFDKNVGKMLLVAKVVDTNSVQYKKRTPNEVVYDNMDKFINGLGVERSEKKAAQAFLDAANLDMETLKIRAIVKDSTFYKFIAPKADGVIYHIASNTIMGRNPAECLEFLRNPLHEKILDDLLKKLEEHWNK